MYISDYDDGPIQIQISGYFQKLQDGTYFVSNVIDCHTVGELVNACGYTPESIFGRPVIISINSDLGEKVE